jgi:hypothetical protein
MRVVIKMAKNKLKSILEEMRWKNMAILFAILFLSIFLFFIVNNYMIPIIFNMLHLFLALVKLYTILDVTGKFFGGFLILYVSWFIFTGLVYVCKFIFNLIMKGWEKLK